MGAKTSIEWTEASWNPIRGCSAVSPGCANCYAERDAGRFSGPGMPYEGLVKLTKKGAAWAGVVRLIEEHLLDPIRWGKPKRIFVNSMSDLFHEELSRETIARIFAVMALAPRHTFQVLTKRAHRMRELVGDPAFRDEVEAIANASLDSGLPLRLPKSTATYTGILLEKRGGAARLRWPLPQVWLGVSVENAPMAASRIPALLDTPAAVRWLSCEPLLGSLLDPRGELLLARESCYCTSPEASYLPRPAGRCPNAARIHWLVIGGESGPHARPFDLAWAREILAKAKAAAVPAFMKQLGARPVAARAVEISDRKGKHPKDWPADLRVREYPRDGFGERIAS